MRKKRFEELNVEGRVQTSNPFKEINSKTYGKAHQEKQKSFTKKHTEELQKDDAYLKSSSSISTTRTD